MSESFAELFEASWNNNFNASKQVGLIKEGKVVAIDNNFVTVDVGLKSEGRIALDEFKNEKNELEAKVGDTVRVYIDAVEDGLGNTKLSREKAKKAEIWTNLEQIHENGDIIKGVITGKVKGGFTIDLNGIRAFLPGSQVDVRPLKDTSHLENKEIDFKLIKLDQKRNNIVVSRRAVIENEQGAENSIVLESLEEGSVVKGVVKNLTDYGAFIDLGGVDGLLHITDISWKRIKHPSDVIQIGQELDVRVLKFDKEKTRVSLGLKQMNSDPWVNIKERYPAGSITKAKVTNLTDYGCFAEIETGVEGLIHVSEMDWTNKNINPAKVVSLGQEIDVMILEIDDERRRISLGIKQTKTNPWAEFDKNFNKGDKVSGAIKSITDFGVFIGLEGGVDGLIHLSDLSWNESGEDAVRKFKKGDVLEAVIITIDVERERISLGLKQLQNDAFANYTAKNDRGAIVKGKVLAVEEKGYVVELDLEVEAFLAKSDSEGDLNVGDEVEAKITNVDRKNRSISLSVKAKNQDDSKEVMKQMKAEKQTTSIGSLLKEAMENKN